MPTLFKTNCLYCGKEMYSYAVNRLGDLEKKYCSKRCESNDKHDKRFIDSKRIR